MTVEQTGCLVSVPIASFRSPRAREYLETLAVPPPATVYGMLSAAVGEVDRFVHIGAEVATGVLGESAQSRVLRTSWRIKDAGSPQGLGENKRPDFQELLTGVRLAILVRAGQDRGAPPLAQRLATAMATPASIRRFGGLSLGESTSLVDEFRPLRESDLSGVKGNWLVASETGELALPIWADHVSGAGTRWGQFSHEPMTSISPPVSAWVSIELP